jgi:hypothetical protein
MWEGYETGRTKEYDMDYWEQYVAELGHVIDWLVEDDDRYTDGEIGLAMDFMHQYWNTIDRDTLAIEVGMLCTKHDRRSPDGRFTLTDRFHEFMVRSVPFFEEKKIIDRLVRDWLGRLVVFPGDGADYSVQLPSPYHELGLEAPRFMKRLDPNLVEEVRAFDVGRFQEPIRSALLSVKNATFNELRRKHGDRAV